MGEKEDDENVVSSEDNEVKLVAQSYVQYYDGGAPRDGRIGLGYGSPAKA